VQFGHSLLIYRPSQWRQGCSSWSIFRLRFLLCFRYPTTSAKACFRLSRCPVCSSVRVVRCYYHDISWTAWKILIKLIKNIH